jgi:CxxC-x17-CxxC domain-containing protein
MEGVGVEYRHLISSGLMDVFKKIWPDVWSARMEYILGNCILALLEYPNSTLLGVNKMLADPEYRKKIVEKVKDPVVKSFWVNEFARYTQRYEVEATAAIQNKIGQLISNPLIRNIIGQVRSKINMRKLMDDGKILIANLSKGRIGEDNSRLLGALLITKLQLSAMSRVEIPEEKRKDFFLYVDEFQNFATEAFANILSEARKYRLSLTLANQYIAQLEEVTPTGKSTKVKDAVFGNVGTLIVFRIGAEDAEYLEKEFISELTIEDLVNLGKYNIYLKLMVEGIAGRPFSAQTLLPFQKPAKSNREKIIKASRERYGVDRKIVEDKIIRWSGLDSKTLSAAALPIKTSQSERGQTLYDAQCSQCGKKTKVIFSPDGVRPVYCKSCLKKMKEEETKTISLSDAEKIGPVSFSSSQKNKEKKEKRPKKEVDIEELKKVLGKALKKDKE